MGPPGGREHELRQAVLNWWAGQRARYGFTARLRVLFSELWGLVLESMPEQRRRRYGDVEYDWDHGVDTASAPVGWRERLLGVFHSPYQPTEPALFHEMLQSLPTDLAGFTFIDLGSGKGRALLMASEYPFRKIIGVELLSELHRVASENLRKYASEKQRCSNLEAQYGDASEFNFPRDPIVLYLFNPLPEASLEAVVQNLERSLRQYPRKVFVLYHNPLLEQVLAASPVLKRTGGTHQYSVYVSV